MSQCLRPTTQELDNYNSLNRGVSYADFIPFFGPIISQAVNTYSVPKKNQERQKQVNDLKANYDKSVDDWRSDISDLVVEDTEIIDNLLTILFGNDDDDGYIDMEISMKTWPQQQLLYYTIVSVIAIAAILFLDIFK
jgi:hypothetical protein